MFLKPYKLKSNTPLKGSETKRLRQRIEQAFPNVTGESMQLIIPSKSNVSMLKVTTHSGFQTNVYCVDKLPMFFETESESLAPTVYALWSYPKLLPYFTTVPAVLPKLSNGADLMLPGIITQGVGMNMYGRYKQGQLVAINLSSNNSAVGIGFLPRSSDDLYHMGGRGSAVKMLQLFGDKLWGHEPSLIQQVPNFKPNDLTNDDFPELGSDVRKKQRIPQPTDEAPKTLVDIVANNNEFVRISAEETPNITLLDIKAASEDEQDEPSSEAISEQPNELILKNAFLSALKNHGKSLTLPLLTSNFFRLYVVPEAEQPIDLKKTKYKKLSNFLNEMIDEGFIVVREENKGVDKITSIDFQHPTLVNFITDYKPPGTASNSEGGQENPLFHSELTELYIVTDVTAAFFTKMDYKRGEGIPSAQIKKIIREYMSQQKLPMIDALTKSYKLDSVLQQICGCETATLSKTCNEVINKMERSYQMCKVKDIASNKPLIQMSLATRSGNKKVTLVSNIESYGIVMSEFIKLCKQGAAASTTMVQLPNQKREQLQIQGNQVRFLFNLLTETYKVPPKCILGLELAKDGKKHKKK